MNNQDTRLNKWISETGICSRREADRLIEAGQVRVNGEVAPMGLRVGPQDRVTVKGKPLKAKPAPVYLAYNKPEGITCTTDPEVPENIVDAVRYKKGRIFPIGRLDKPSEGLILLTNDGDIVNKILRAGNAHEKEYIVEVDRPFGKDFVEKMAAGVPILDTVTQPCQVRQLSARSFNIILTQGLNRQIRRMTEYLGFQVTRLQRVRIMNISLGSLKKGQWRELNAKEMAIINRMIATSSGTEEASLPAKATPSKKPAGARKKSSAGKRPAPASRGKPPVKKSGKKPYAGGKNKKKAKKLKPSQ
ncbi:23S rRNA pseudouridine(2604) synthase RluF [Marinospirillum perlucidum]|uniref:23S rRNA pseudouridine(2604) synthase RluF n=1 Tax=Marinospirillum perlucidum TaxID=1982602 RepID=UPI000DF1290B|nr:23S rRNA pseudouridine(2604) synthase RluF [Marinospirillum perlucidum]